MDLRCALDVGRPMSIYSSFGISIVLDMGLLLLCLILLGCSLRCFRLVMVDPLLINALRPWSNKVALSISCPEERLGAVGLTFVDVVVFYYYFGLVCQ